MSSSGGKFAYLASPITGGQSGFSSPASSQADSSTNNNNDQSSNNNNNNNDNNSSSLGAIGETIIIPNNTSHVSLEPEGIEGTVGYINEQRRLGYLSPIHIRGARRMPSRVTISSSSYEGGEGVNTPGGASASSKTTLSRLLNGSVNTQGAQRSANNRLRKLKVEDNIRQNNVTIASATQYNNDLLGIMGISSNNRGGNNNNVSYSQDYTSDLFREEASVLGQQRPSALADGITLARGGALILLGNTNDTPGDFTLGSGVPSW